MQRNSYQVRVYNIKHNYEIMEFLEAYRALLQRAVDEIWNKLSWRERVFRGRRRLIPVIPKENCLRVHYLRNLLMQDWRYSMSIQQ